MASLLADAILVIHFLFVLFVVGGFAYVVAGSAIGWRTARNRTFRVLHLAAIVFVALESLVGAVCPLTRWEDALRASGGGEAGFVGRWVSRLLYYDFPEWAFTAVYVAFALAVAAAWKLIPPLPGASVAAPSTVRAEPLSPVQREPGRPPSAEA